MLLTDRLHMERKWEPQQRDNRHDPAPPAAVRRAQAHNTMTDYHHRHIGSSGPHNGNDDGRPLIEVVFLLLFYS